MEFHTDIQNLCPQCREPLHRSKVEDIDAWECDSGHGVGLTLTEGWEHFHTGEMKAIWDIAKTARPSDLREVNTTAAMVTVDLVSNADEGHAAGPQPRVISVDVDRQAQFIWFAVGFNDLHPQPPGASPSKEELERQEEVVDAFGKRLLAVGRQRQSEGMLNKFADMASAHAGVRRFANGIARTGARALTQGRQQ